MKSKNNNSTQIMKKRRSTTITVAVVAAILSALFYILMNMRVAHMHVVFIFILAMSFLVLTYMIIWTLGSNEKYSRLTKILKCCYFICASIGLIFFIILQALIVSGSRTEEADVEAIIVLGAGLTDNYPSLILAARLDAAITFLHTQGDIPIITTGGLGRGQIFTEAEAMADYLIARGVEESRIWKEEASTNSHENINLTKELWAKKALVLDNIKVAMLTKDSTSTEQNYPHKTPASIQSA